MTEQNKGACCDVDVIFTKMKTCETIITSCHENGHCNVNNQIPFHLVLMVFSRYHARPGRERSGAYLFLPDREAEIIPWDFSAVRVVEGPLFSQVHMHLPGVQHTVTLVNTPGLYTAFSMH